MSDRGSAWTGAARQPITPRIAATWQRMRIRKRSIPEPARVGPGVSPRRNCSEARRKSGPWRGFSRSRCGPAPRARDGSAPPDRRAHGRSPPLGAVLPAWESHDGYGNAFMYAMKPGIVVTGTVNSAQADWGTMAEQVQAAFLQQ